jgi:hypothetical protein
MMNIKSRFKTLLPSIILHLRTKLWLVLFCLVLAAIVPQVLPVLGARELAGWDTHGHLFMTELMATFLREGKVSGYVLDWEAGFPAFSLYPPLFFILTSAPAALLPSLLSVSTCYHLMVFFLPLLFAAAVMGYARASLPQSAWIGVPVVLLLYLMLPGLGAHGIGLESLLAAGLVPSFFALVLFTLFAWSIERLLEAPRLASTALAGVVLGALFLSHTLTSVFCLLYLAITALLGSRRTLAPLAGVVCVAFLISAWWTVPFIRNLPYSSGEAIVDNNALSPLSIFFPIGPATSRLLTTGKLERDLLAFEQPIGGFFSYQNALGIFFLVTVAIGLASSLRRREYRLPLIFLVGVALVPGGFILSAFGLPLHAYRFSACLWVIEILLSAEGLSLLARRSNHRAAIAVGSLFTLVCLGFCINAWLRLGALGSSGSFFIFRVENRSGFQSGEGLMRFLADNRPKGRIAVESDMRSLRIFGSPHWLLTEIPRRLKIPSVPGVYAESSLASPFITPTLASLGNQLVWGAPEIARRGSFMRQSRRSMVERLRLFSVEMVVATSGRMRKSLGRLRRFGVKSVYENADLALFSIGEPRPFIETFKSKPFLFIDKGGLSFRSFTKWLYTTPDLFAVPLLDGSQMRSMPANISEQVSGVLVSCSRSSELKEQELSVWKTWGPVVLLNCQAKSLPKNAPSDLTRIPYLFREYHLMELSKALLPRLQPSPALWSVQVESFENERITGSSSGPVLVRNNAARCWREKRRGHGVLAASPSFMALLGEGPFELEYGC